MKIQLTLDNEGREADSAHATRAVELEVDNEGNVIESIWYERVEQSEEKGFLTTLYNGLKELADTIRTRKKVWPPEDEGEKGGPESGHHGHGGRPGKRGGSIPGKQASVYGSGTPADLSIESSSTGRLNAYLNQSLPGKQDDSTAPHWSNVDYDTRGELKNEVVVQLSEKVDGLDYDQVNRVIEQWSISSADTDKRSLEFQKMAGETLGIEVRDSITERIKEKEDELESLPGDEDFKKPGIISDSYFGFEEFGIPAEGQRLLVEEMYSRTQASLRSAGFEPGDTVRLYRGVMVNKSVAGEWKIGDIVGAEGNPLQSWSAGVNVAEKFAGSEYLWYHFVDDVGVVLAMDVPIENIVSTPSTGIGCLVEGEFVILGDELGHQATVQGMKFR